ncbi:MAG: hypothetical protein JWQ04_217 [Pedosphaera sp.]|nr:hypothetical protein [Pedosphaera sp.]
MLLCYFAAQPAFLNLCRPGGTTEIPFGIGRNVSNRNINRPSGT